MSEDITGSVADLDILYEEEILRNPFSLKLWWRYIQAKKGSTSKIRNLLYERALKQLPGSFKLWHSYLLERREQVRGRCLTHPSYEVVNNCFERALVFMHKMPRIWIEYLQFLMDQKKATRTRRTFDRSLKSLPITQHDRIWPMYLKFVRNLGVPETALRVYRRYLKLEPSHIEDFIDFLLSIKSYDEAAALIAKCVGDEDFISIAGKNRHQMYSELCELISQHPEQIKSLKVDAIIQNGAKRFSDEVGKMWISLAEYFTRMGHFEKARDVYEEAVGTVMTVRDFSMVFDAYAQFEETTIATKMELQAENDEEEVDDDLDEEGNDLDLRLARLEYLMDRRPVLLSSVLLRQNPHNVHEWHKRVKLFQDNPAKIVQTYSDACKTVDPHKAVGKAHTLWIAFAKFYEEHGDLDNARLIFDKAVQVNYKGVDDLATVWCEYAEMELRSTNYERALQLMQKATLPPMRRPRSKNPAEVAQDVPVQDRLFRSTKLWSFYADLEESLGSFSSTKAVYEKMIELKICTPQIIINFAHFLEENKFFEDSFKVYEQGVNLFGFPHAMDIWIAYLTKFVSRYGGKKLERARDLYEQALEKCPAKDCKVLYVMYAKLEEDYGLARHAMSIYDRACKAVPDDQKFDMYLTYIARATELFGVAKTREIYESAIEKLPDKYVKDICLRYGELERKLGEIDRARAIYNHAAQFSDPRVETQFWAVWHQFEVTHGNEDTFRDMLRIKRSVQATYTQVSFTSSQMLQAARQADEENLNKRQKPETGMEALDRQAEEILQTLGPSAPAAAQAAAAPAPQGAKRPRQPEPDLEELAELGKNPDMGPARGSNSDEEEDDSFQLKEKPVPDAVFGGIRQKQAEGGEEPMGALARFKRKKQ